MRAAHAFVSGAAGRRWPRASGGYAISASPTSAVQFARAPVPSTDVRTPAPRAKGEHRYDVDLIRVLASVAVILCHSAAQLMAAVDRHPEGGRPVYWVGITGDALTRWAVPLFFAMAGWIVLSGAPPRDGRQVGKRLTRIVVPMAVWTAGYLVFDWARNVKYEESKRQIAYDSVFGFVQPSYHLWYLYAYVPLVLVLSVIVLVRAGKRPWGTGAVLLALGVAAALLEDLSKHTDWRIPTYHWAFTTYQLVYAIIGAVLLSLPRSSVSGRRRRLYWLAGALCAWVAVTVYQDRVKFPSSYGSIVVAALAGSILMAFNRIRVPERFRPMLGRLATASFGAYLVHLMFLETIAPHVVRAHAGWLTATGTLVGLTVVTVVLSFAAALLWNRLRLARWLG